MSEASATEEFGVGRCRECGRETLAIPDFGDEGTWRCAHCDERVERTRWIAAGELETLGYELSDGKPAHSGCTSCVSGGCGIRANG